MARALEKLVKINLVIAIINFLEHVLAAVVANRQPMVIDLNKIGIDVVSAPT